MPLDRFELIFELTHGDQLLVPSPFEFARDQAIIRIDGVILPAGKRRLVTRLLERKLYLAALLGGLRLAGLDRFESGLNAERLQEPHDLSANRLINAQAAEGDAAISAVVQEAALAVIPACFAVRAPIGDMQLPTAMSAAQETGQQRLAAADRSTRHETFAVGVVGDQALIPLELRP